MGGHDAPAAPPRRRRPVEDEYVDLPAESRIPRWLVAIGVLVLIVGLAIGGARWWYGNQVDPPGDPGEAVAVTVPEGASSSHVADILEGEGVITNATLFGFWVGGKDLQTIQAGEYTFQLDSSFGEAVDVLNAGPEVPLGAAVTKVTIPEGYTVAQIVERISESVPRFTAEELQAALDGGEVPSALKPEGTTSYEGLLFPATYEVTDEDTALDLLTMMAQEMESRATALGIEEAAATASARTGVELRPYDLIVIASLVQEEAGNPDEADQIAAVIENRLEAGWALGIDATSRYLAEIEGTELDFTSTSPYNTRTQRGLPPTPIATPGEFALEAAIAPADGPWMYYVLTEPTSHTFVVTDAEFQEAKQLCIERDLGCG